MKILGHALVLLALCGARVLAGQVAFEGAEGFGALARGGAGGHVLSVTTLADDPQRPAPGSLRWAINQQGARVVHFAVAGNIHLKAPLVVREPLLTIDGGDAPGQGVCLCDHSLILRSTHDVVVQHLRLRHGDVETLKAVDAAHLQRPRNSHDLDCVSVDDSHDVIFDHCSLSWSCDEVFGIVGCRNVTIQWCLIAEPLANPRIHPYGDHHAYGLNLSASTLSVHHCLIAHYVMRGPQFEANDMRRHMRYDVQMEAVNNVLFDYERSGSRYTTGIEDHPGEADHVHFDFQFVNNHYLAADDKGMEIEAVTKHGVVDRVRMFCAGNLGPHCPDDHADPLACVFVEGNQPMRNADASVLAQVSAHRLFQAPVPVIIEGVESASARVLRQAGCSNNRDSVDERIVDDVKLRRFGRIVKSQDAVGGWPELK